MLFLLTMTLASCDSDDESNNDKYWFDGKYFSARATTNDGQDIWMVLHFKHDKLSTAQRYYFTVEP